MREILGLTYNGGQGAVAALNNITATQASVQVKEWDYLDGGHYPEDISLLALPPGRYPQADGSIWEVGRFTLSGTRQWHSVTFDQAFEATPYLLLTQQSQNAPEATSIRARNIDTTGFQAFLQEQESLNNGHAEEIVGYLAIYSPSQGGTATFYGTSFNYQLSQLSLNHTWTAQGDQELKIQEEASLDNELGHVTETLDILRIEGHLFAQDVTANGWDTMALRRRGPTSTVLLSGNPTEQGVVYLHTDHLGAVIKATDGDQNIVWDAVRKPCGERIVTTEQIEMQLGFPGQYFDEETGNYYNYFRDYDPTTGRYLQSDPIGLDGGLNTYAYVEGNPIINIDYYGLYGEVGIRPFYPTPVPYARHCFLRFNGNNNDTLSFSNTGVGPDPNPGGAQYNPIPGTQDDACLRREMKKCGADHYRFCRFNCCRCIANAINACKLKDPGNWPNEPCDASNPPYPLPVPPWQDPMWDELIHGQ